MDILLHNKFVPPHGMNRMKQEGDVVSARKLFYENPPKNLKFLLGKRFSWMNQFIKATDVGIEVGCGTGLSKEFIECNNYTLTDYANHPWIDINNVDALNTPFENNSQDFIVSSNMIHHVPYPKKFFVEMHRILKPGGKLIIQEINGSWCMRFVLKLMRHEGYDRKANVWNENEICTDPNDLWSANCVIPNLLFDDIEKFKNEISYFEVTHTGFSEFFTFFNSGGVISKTKYVPLPLFMLKFLWGIDVILCKIAPQFFALQRQIVLVKK